MYIQEVVIEGFKSYAQRTVVSGFDPQFNAITGLNGTGKSNILDSICFVLGISNLSQGMCFVSYVGVAKSENLINGASVHSTCGQPARAGVQTRPGRGDQGHRNNCVQQL
jgi:AAA15 family ATPase/GTPase